VNNFLVEAVAPVLRHFALNSSAKSFAVRYSRPNRPRTAIFFGATPEIATVMNLKLNAGPLESRAETTTMRMWWY